jgi:zinc/manganese transport system permease protein
MTELLRSMAWPFAACLLLAVILVYLGIHVISRKVIFVDLALAQIAALGSVWGVLLGWDLQNDPWVVKAFALAFTFLGAAVFTSTRMRDERVPHEALIGITYAVALGATILASSHLAHGAEEVSELMAGASSGYARRTSSRRRPCSPVGRSTGSSGGSSSSSP